MQTSLVSIVLTVAHKFLSISGQLSQIKYFNFVIPAAVFLT
jgi:hypothetical protein